MLPRRLIEIEANNKFLFAFGKFARFCYFEFKSICSDSMAFLRRKGLIDRRYLPIRQLKNSHNGERCFVLATGPSLTLSDIEKLDGEFSFGMNSICLLYDRTNWRPSMFCIQDVDVYDKIADVLEKSPQNVYVSSNLAKRRGTGALYHVFPFNEYYHLFDYRYSNKLNSKFSDNAYSIVYDAYSITFSIIQIAIYMGFKEIYLLGCDCNQAVGKQNHFIETGQIEEVSKLRTAADRMIFSHTKLKQFADMRGVKIYNATRGGKLEVYPRVDLDQLLKS